MNDLTFICSKPLKLMWAIHNVTSLSFCVYPGTSCIGDLELLLGCVPYIWTIQATVDVSMFRLNKRNAKRFVLGQDNHYSNPVPITFSRIQLSMCQILRSCLELRSAVMTPETQSYLMPYLQKLDRYQAELTSILQPQLMAEQRMAHSSKRPKLTNEHPSQLSKLSLRSNKSRAEISIGSSLQNNRNRSVDDTPCRSISSRLTRTKTVAQLFRRNAWVPVDANGGEKQLHNAVKSFNLEVVNKRTQTIRAGSQSSCRNSRMEMELILEKNRTKQLEVEVAMFVERVQMADKSNDSLWFPKDIVDRPDSTKVNGFFLKFQIKTTYGTATYGEFERDLVCSLLLISQRTTGHQNPRLGW